MKCNIIYYLFIDDLSSCNYSKKILQQGWHSCWAPYRQQNLHNNFRNIGYFTKQKNIFKTVFLQLNILIDVVANLRHIHFQYDDSFFQIFAKSNSAKVPLDKYLWYHILESWGGEDAKITQIPFEDKLGNNSSLLH